MASFRDLLAQAKSAITEVDTADAATRIERGVIVLDVREPDEYEQGALPSALHIPRGHLEAQIETKIVDKSAPIVVYCAGGVRSAFAARSRRSPATGFGCQCIARPSISMPRSSTIRRGTPSPPRRASRRT